ncbi:MAG: trigger factor, partial [Spongiibacteraceae bacterium]
MQVSVETTSGLERRLIVGVPADRVDSKVDSRLQEAARTVKINGFRPGKVPMGVVRKRFGESVRMEVLGEVMNESFYEAIQQ